MGLNVALLLQSIGGLFALASMPSHSCVANATHDFSRREDGFKMTMRSVVKIPKGSDITHSYTEPLDSILTRSAPFSNSVLARHQT